MTTFLLPITMREAWHLVKRTATLGNTNIQHTLTDTPCYYDSGRTTPTDTAYTLGMRTGPCRDWPQRCTMDYHTSHCFHSRPAKNERTMEPSREPLPCKISSKSIKLLRKNRDFFDFSRWRASAILDLLNASLDHPQRVFTGPYLYAKFG